jgi:16S rRNA (guanine966-N2)-methyltransferase
MLRLTGGQWKGRAIRTPPSLKTRPSHSRLREALFNTLQGQVEGKRVLDLFAGSGSLGFEALSRGAAHAVFVEKNRLVIKIIEENALTFKATEKVEVRQEEVERYLQEVEKLSHCFDLIFADPPYEKGWEKLLFEKAPFERILLPGGLFCLESSAKEKELPDETDFLVKIREKKYGDSLLTSYRRRETAKETKKEAGKEAGDEKN